MKPYIRTASGMVALAAKFRTATGLVNIGGGSSTLAATASPDNLFGASSENAPAATTSNETTVSVTGGAAPYTYLWSTQSGWTRTAPTSATCAFRKVINAGASDSTTFTCTVTDANGSTVTTNAVTANLTNYGS